MQRPKREAKQEAGTGTARVTYPAADFNMESWLDLNPKLPTFVFWEGVVVHLKEETVHAPLGAVGPRRDRQGLLIFDLFDMV